MIGARRDLLLIEFSDGAAELNTIWRQPARKSPCDDVAGAAALVVIGS
jgi:hypothetical protein